MENDQLFELMTRMYGEMQEGFKEVNSKINTIDGELKDVKSTIEDFREETNKKFDDLGDKLNDLEATNATNHVSIKARLNKVSDDLDFLSHKEFQTEREMYHIKQKLMDRKRKIK